MKTVIADGFEGKGTWQSIAHAKNAARFGRRACGKTHRAGTSAQSAKRGTEKHMGIIKEIIYWTCVAGMIGTAAINLYCASRYQKMKKDLEAITESARKAKEMADEYLGKAVAWHDRAESCLSGRGSD